MIALNTATGVVEVNNWLDIQERPHFRSDLDPASVELKEIIGSYQFGEEVNCGLTVCHQPHKRGYLVMTKEGFETNIGKDCGKKYFSVDFVDMKVKFDKDIKISLQREVIKKAKLRTEDLEKEVENLRKAPKGADWIYERVGKLKNPNVVGASAANELKKMLKMRRKELLIPRIATEEEREEAIAMDPSLKAKLNGEPYFIDTVVGSVNYAEAMLKDNDLKEILIRDVTRTLKLIKECDLETIRTRDLANLAKDANTLDAKIAKAKDTVEIGRKFLSKENLSSLVSWVDKTSDDKNFSLINIFVASL
ncbi:hypothetical protein ORG37_18755 [Rahnella perminowiae]|uniref:hypothetical protein n=1 Tax=Rahnella perminowiae TaxID=2816244 RepID=UPI00224ACCF0|nr:hypothetical protein [Rahnella perminowiae]MCX2945125.1 hypothetical protein [Rahnella perminowiae]